MTDDPRLPADLALLKTFQIRAVIDYIKWSDGDDTTPAQEVKDIFGDRVRRLGKRWTLHDLRYPHLRDLPPAVLSKPLDALELSVDFRPKQSKSMTERKLLIELGNCQALLARRLAPWQGKGVGDRIYIQDGEGDLRARRGHLSRDVEFKPNREGVLLAYVKEHTPVSLCVPKRTPRGGVWSSTLYYGHKPDPYMVAPSGLHQALRGEDAASENDDPDHDAPQPIVQVRLYVKTYDRGAPIKARTDWRTRMEVTLNRAALLDKGAKKIDRVGDLLKTGLLRPLVREYLKLTLAGLDEEALVAMRKRLGGRKKRTPMQNAFRHLHTQQASRNLKAAKNAGALEVGNAEGVKFKTVATLNRRIGDAVGQFHRGTYNKEP